MPAFRQLLHDTHQVVQVAPEAIKLPDDQGIALAQSLETGREAGSAILLARGAVLIDKFLGHACRGQGVVLEIEVLCVAGLGDAGVSDVHVLYGRLRQGRHSPVKDHVSCFVLPTLFRRS